MVSGNIILETELNFLTFKCSYKRHGDLKLQKCKQNEISVNAVRVRVLRGTR
jgi:hypothetical protein